MYVVPHQISTGCFCTLKCKNIPRLVAKNCLKTKCSDLGLHAGWLLRYCSVYITNLVQFHSNRSESLHLAMPEFCRAKFGKVLVKAASPKLDVYTGFFLYTSFKQRKWQDGKEWPCFYNFTTKALRLSEDVSSKAKEELAPSVLTMRPMQSPLINQ